MIRQEPGLKQVTAKTQVDRGSNRKTVIQSKTEQKNEQGPDTAKIKQEVGTFGEELDKNKNKEMQLFFVIKNVNFIWNNIPKCILLYEFFVKISSFHLLKRLATELKIVPLPGGLCLIKDPFIVMNLSE